MTRKLMLGLVPLTAALLLAGGTALAKEITCGAGRCVGTDRSDTMIGTLIEDVIVGRDGGDVINGRAGSDELRGGRGNDQLVDDAVGADGDRLFGGKGDDILQMQEHDGSADFADCGPGHDQVTADPTDTFVNCEVLNGLPI